MDKKEFEKKIEDNTNEILEDTLLDEDAPFEDTRAIKYEDIIQNTTKEKISKVPWIAAIFIIVIISITFGYMFLNSNPQTIFTMTIDNLFNNLSKNISDDSYDISKGNFKINLDLKGNELLEDVSNLSIDADYAIDRTNNLSKVKAKTKYNGENLINFDVYNDSKNTYIYSKDIYDTYLKIDNVYNMFSQSDMKNVLNGINQAIDKVATSEKIIGQKTSYDDGEKSVDAYESKLIIDEKNYERIAETFINCLKSNDEFVISMSNLLGVKTDEVIKRLDDYLPNLKSLLKDNKTEIILYTNRKTNEFIKGEIKNNNFYIEYNQDKSSFIISHDNQKLTGNVNLEKNKNKYNLTLNFEFENGNDKINGNIDITFTNKKSSSFGNVNVGDAKDINDLSDIEKLSIYSKLFTNTNLSKFLKYVA